ncbi:hypothetical protein WBG83_00035 [Paenibacillus sp. y28]
MKLSFLCSPLMFGKALRIMDEETYEMVGAAGFVLGTGANHYEDREICQVEVAFIRKEYRSSPLFVQLLESLVATMKEANPDLAQVQFWVPAEQKDLDRLCSKFLALPGSVKSVVNKLAFYTVPFPALEAYCRRLKRA